MTPAPHAAAPQPASHAWCCVCQMIRPFRTEPIADASKRASPTMTGNRMVCDGCETTLASIYAVPA